MRRFSANGSERSSYACGFAGEKKSTFAEIGRELGVTRERVRQLEAKAILKLRKTEYYQSVQNFFET